jgi:hypothetical protein
MKTEKQEEDRGILHRSYMRHINQKHGLFPLMSFMSILSNCPLLFHDFIS